MQKRSKTYCSVHWGTMSWWAICSGFGGPVQSVHSNSAGVTKYIHQASSTLELRTHPKCQAALSAKEVGPGLLLRPQIADINARSRWVMSMRWCKNTEQKQHEGTRKDHRYEYPSRFAAQFMAIALSKRRATDTRAPDILRARTSTDEVLVWGRSPPGKFVDIAAISSAAGPK